jgi:hypothetical protein
MPAYVQSSATLSLATLFPGASVDVFSAEAVTNGEYSQALALSNYPLGSGNPISLDLEFSAAPGNFTFNVVFSAKDSLGSAGYSMPDTTYQVTQAQLDPVTGTSVHLDMPYTNARFVALYVSSKPANAVTTTATFKR